MSRRHPDDDPPLARVSVTFLLDASSEDGLYATLERIEAALKTLGAQRLELDYE